MCRQFILASDLREYECKEETLIQGWMVLTGSSLWATGGPDCFLRESSERLGRRYSELSA